MPKSRWPVLVCVALAVIWLVLRLVGLENAPPGFYVDELGGALNAICLRQTGHTFYNAYWPMFPAGGGGGLQSPVFTYFSVAWTALWGDSIATFRSIPAVFSIGTVLVLFFLTRELFGLPCAIWTLVVAALSPWSFQFARISWDAPLFPFFLLAGLWVLVRSRRTDSAIVAGVLLSLSAYCYSGGRVQTPLLLAAMFGTAALRRRIGFASLAATTATWIFFSLPMLFMSATPVGQSRMLTVGITAPYFIEHQAGGSYLRLFWIFICNLASHFGFGFLFLHGDTNARHSTEHIGELGGLEILAIVLAVALIVSYVRNREKRPVELWSLLLLAGAGIFSGLTPAALTWESIPHALRGMGAWPFVALSSGWVLWRATSRWPRVRYLVVSVALAHSIYFAKIFFVDYPKEFPHWFDVYVQEGARNAARNGTWDAFIAESVARKEWGATLRFYSILYHGETCESSERAILSR